MLLQIQDPQSKNALTESVAVGIDFGTTNSAISVVANGQAKIIGNLVPSVVSIDTNGNCSVGNLNKKGSIRSVKRLLAKMYEDIKDVPMFLDTKFSIAENRLTLTLNGQIKTPVEIASEIFKHLKKLAESNLGQNVNQAVVTVPAYFDEMARSQVKAAAKLAGFDVLRLVAEPTAAALSYGLDEKTTGTYMVYDLGGGTFDVSILKMEDGIFHVLATGGNSMLGGDDIDALLSNYLFHCPHKTLEAKKVKETLQNDQSQITINRFNELIDPLVQETIHICKSTLKHCNYPSLDGVILVGGSTRIPYVSEMITKTFNLPIFSSLNPDEVVALGAAYQAENLTLKRNRLLIDVTPLTLGVEMLGGIVDKIIDRNTPIPTSKAQKFTTFKDNQTAMDLHIVQGERELAKDCRSLGQLELHGIPPLPAGHARVLVTFTLDADGLLTVDAKEETTGIAQTLTLKPTYGLSESDLEKMILESHKNATADMERRFLQESITKSKQLIYAVEKAIEVDKDVLCEDELSSIQHVIRDLHEALLEGNRDPIEKKRETLDQLTQEFAHKRIQKYM